MFSHFNGAMTSITACIDRMVTEFSIFLIESNSNSPARSTSKWKMHFLSMVIHKPLANSDGQQEGSADSAVS